MTIMKLILAISCLLVGSQAETRMDCEECLDQMHGLGQLIKAGGGAIEVVEHKILFLDL